MTESPIYGSERIAEYLGISESTLRRWRGLPEGSFLDVGSMSNIGGGLGQALYSFPSSLDNLKRIVRMRVSEQRRLAALVRWNYTDVRPLSNIKTAVVAVQFDDT